MAIREFRRNRKSYEQKRAAERKRKDTRTHSTDSATWKRIRAQVLREEPICRMCRSKGRTTPANEVDHIDGDPNNHAPNNLQALCSRCHTVKSMRETRNSPLPVALYPDWLRPIPNCHVVIGPPASGKTTYVREHAREGDRVIDLDEIQHELFGVRWSPRQEHWRVAMRERNARLRDAARAGVGRTWVVLAEPIVSKRKWWYRKLEPVEVHDVTKLIDGPLIDVCLARIHAQRPALVAPGLIDALMQWDSEE